MWIHTWRSRGPASRSPTRWRPDAVRRLARTQPAEPAPTITKSASAAACILSREPPGLGGGGGRDFANPAPPWQRLQGVVKRAIERLRAGGRPARVTLYAEDAP